MENSNELLDFCKKLIPQLELFQKYVEKEESLQAEMAAKQQEYGDGLGKTDEMKVEFNEFCADKDKKLAQLNELKRNMLRKLQAEMFQVFENIVKGIGGHFKKLGIEIPENIQQLIGQYRKQLNDQETENVVDDLKRFQNQLEAQSVLLAKIFKPCNSN